MFQKKGIDAYFYMDQMARMKFRLLHLLLEICKYALGFTPVPVGTGHTSVAPWEFHVCFRVGDKHGSETFGGRSQSSPCL